VLGRQAFGEGDDRRLGGAVGGHPSLPLGGRAGRDVDDTAAALLQHVGNDGPAAVEHRTGVEVHHEVPVFVLGLVQRWSHYEAAGDVGQDVDTLEPGQYPVGHIGDRIGLDQIGGYREGIDPHPQPRLGGVQGTLLQVHQGQSRTLVRQCLGHGPSQVATGTGHQGYFAFESLHHVSLTEESVNEND